MNAIRNLGLGVGLLGLVGILAACGGDARETATAVIETEIADQVGLGELTADCEEPENPVVGETFACSATTESGELIRLTVEFEDDDRIFVLPTNVLLGDDMPLVEAEAAQVLGDEIGVEIDASDVDCGDDSRVMDANDQMTCTITDTSSGTTFELVVTLTEFVRDQGFQSRFYEIGAAIE